MKKVRKQSDLRADYVTLLSSIFDFMFKSGMQKLDVRQQIDSALANVVSSDQQTMAHSSASLAIAAVVLDAWHRNRRYLTADGSPIAVRLLGASPSVEALIRAEHPQENPAHLARKLKSAGLLKSCGRSLYKPASRSALLAGLDPMVQQYVAKSSATLLKTMMHNISCRKPSARLIERFAEIPDLPRRHAAEFRRFAHAQGNSFIQTLNDWLESRRLRPRRTRAGSSMRAGVHLYAYAAPARRARRRPD